MKKLTLIMVGAVLALSCIVSNAITNTAIAISGTNLVLYWPSYGYESYLVQYRETLDPTDSWSQVVNAYPAHTNQTTYTLYGLASGGSGSGGGAPHAAMMASASPAPGLVAIANDGSGTFPVEIFPPGMDFSGYEIFDPETGTVMSGTNFSVAVNSPSTMTATADDSTPLTPNPQPYGGGGGGGGGGSSNPTTGFFRVFHVPDWLSTFNGYTFDGPTFIPVDYELPDAGLDYVESSMLLINGQPTDNALFTPYVYNSVTNWGMGVYFDRFPNGTATMQLITTVRETDDVGDDTTYMTFSNNPVTITIGNEITFTNWADLMTSNTYTFNAQSMTPNVNWQIDIYDVNNNWVTSQTGYSSDGNISWTWGITDSTGASRLDDGDPFFYPEITVTPASTPTNQVPGGSIQRPMPPVANQFPSVGDWIFTYMDNFYTDGTTNYPGADTTFRNALNNMEGGPVLWNLGILPIPLKYGQVYSQADRDYSWSVLQSWLESWNNRNLYYNGHGAPSMIGGDYNVLDSSNYIVGAQVTQGSKARLDAKWVHDNVTYNKYYGAMPFRFVWLDGCNTASTNSTWPWAWGVPNQAVTIDYYTGAGNTQHSRPSAFVGWNTRVGGSKDWGTITGYWNFRQDWMGNWSVQNGNPNDNLNDVFDQALTGSSWVAPGQLHDHMKIYGYSTMKFTEYNHSGDWQ